MVDASGWERMQRDLEVVLERHERLLAQQELLIERLHNLGPVNQDYVSEKSREVPTPMKSNRRPLSRLVSDLSSVSMTSKKSQKSVNSELVRETSRKISVDSNFHLHKEHGAVLHNFLYARFSAGIDWWLALQEPKRVGLFAKFVQSNLFETISVCVIIMNSAFVTYTTDREVNHMGEQNSTTSCIEMSFLTYYVLELVAKMWVHRWHFFCNNEMQWNIFDFFLVMLAMYDWIWTKATESSGSTNLTFMRVIRILKITKALRMVKLINFFSKLRLILNSLLGSFSSLMWSIVMLGLIFFMFALVFVQGVTPVLMDPTLDHEKEEEVREHFGSVSNAIFTLFQTTFGGDDWGNFYVSIREAGHFYSALFVFFVAFIQIALVNVLTGVFVDNAMKLAQPDHDALALEMRKTEVGDAQQLRQLIVDMDSGKDGKISKADFADSMKKDKLRAQLAVLGLDIKNTQIFFDLIVESSKNEEVDIDEFITHCMRLKGTASSFDMQTLVFATKLIQKDQVKMRKILDERFDYIMTALSNVGWQRQCSNGQDARHAKL
eukprot:CAMPEP_0180564782 /NCGR_PEP_ID=MMETSP1037_2-20121125/5193_1 /TAXON_ID=632150 /ORGANISM="Azadinium spinosum, Strain 3D9" /LENGTH=548 /DNA_ID=CAMNT_0022581703 /DNA_START=1 /DNA_END=1647 /DNA_ORIENTATION=-